MGFIYDSYVLDVGVIDELPDDPTKSNWYQMVNGK